MLRQVVVHDQRVHAVVHEPFAHGGTREWREVLARGRVGRRCGDDDRVGHRPGLFEGRDDARDRRLLLADRHVDAVERTIGLVAGGSRGRVEARLADDRVDANGRLAGRTVADDELALTAADRDHRVDRHDSCLHRLADWPSPHDPRRDLLDRIRDVARDRSLAVQGLPEHIHDPAEQPLADRHLEQLAGRADLPALLQPRVVAENDDADVGVFEAQRQAGDAVAEIEHLVEHDVAQTLDARDAVADLADHADVLPGDGGLGARDPCFDFLYQRAHRFIAPLRSAPRGRPGRP